MPSRTTLVTCQRMALRCLITLLLRKTSHEQCSVYVFILLFFFRAIARLKGWVINGAAFPPNQTVYCSCVYLCIIVNLQKDAR